MHAYLTEDTSAHAHARLHAYARERERESMCVRYVFVCVCEREYTPLGIRGRSLRAVNVAAYLSLSAPSYALVLLCVCVRERERERERVFRQTNKQMNVNAPLLPPLCSSPLSICIFPPPLLLIHTHPAEGPLDRWDQLLK